MSSLESFDNDLLKKEERERFTKEDEDNLDEFVGKLQDAFHFGKKNLEENLVYIALTKTFKEYYKDTSLDITRDYIKAKLKIYS
ncbi:hypothetical protein QUR76_06765 [Arcobacter cryaerophilus gv. pseudocryaerophilus]|uniref:Uncharacterized protein n=3 Tax=unclassified Arcobacter TaxID=2593671 RepID=A0AA96L775_9BACT|nr:hypothetical protein RMQ65_01330 [Arcobacter sp. AZ-2023]WPD04827.1 hypothetical protein QUR76_06765 [Arcobacter sp. DSM 115956]WPD06922.1 hypothetical protein QUR78_06765 [Arcobacter sp. DSM 115955]WNL31187.1 hypothetical protein RMQ67_06765 [Arcobacter sp. AZ-2023]WNP37337.1 hypothetical protein RJG58_06765 [Arcobacter sp. AZ-2023]